MSIIKEGVQKRETERAEAIQRRKQKEQQLARQREQRALAGRERLRRDRVESSVRAALRRREAERRERALLVSEAVELAMHAVTDRAVDFAAPSRCLCVARVPEHPTCWRHSRPASTQPDAGLDPA